jgi:arylsulfatase A-like enzyme
VGARARTLARWLPALVCALASCGRAARDAAPAAPHNVVWFVVDTLRADHLGLYGYARDTSPFLDRFAKERGVVFDAARATAPWTKPSVASLLTGLDPRHHQVTLHHHRLHSSLDSLPEVLAARGFQTAAVQSNILLASPFGYGQGFDTYDEDALAAHDTSTGEQVHAEAVRWLREERDPSRPFFLYVHHYEPHFDYLRAGDAFADAPYEGPLKGGEAMDELIAATPLLTDADVEFLRARYDAEIRYQDELFERFVAELDALGLARDTLLVFTADHGEEFREHGRLSHQHTLFDELLRVPLVLALPGDPHPGRRVRTPVSLVDVGRTTLDLLGIDDRSFPGRSLRPLFAGEPARGPEPTVLAQTETLPAGATEPLALEAVVSGGWKLVRDPRAGTRALYGLSADPGELVDLAARDPKRADELERELDDWLARNADRRRDFEAEVIELSEDTLRRMRDLGYFGDE